MAESKTFYTFRDNQVPIPPIPPDETYSFQYIGNKIRSSSNPSGSIRENSFGELIDGSRVEKYSETEFTATMIFTCDWDQRYVVANLLNSSVYPYAEHVSGADYKDYYYDAFCIDQSISVFQEVGEVNVNDKKLTHLHYTKAKITCQYKAWAKPAIWNADVQYSPMLEARTLPTWGFYWNSDRSPIAEDQAPFIMDFSMNIDVTFQNLTVLNKHVWNMNGKVFASTLVDSIFAEPFAPGTILFTVKNLSRKRSISKEINTRLWTLTVGLSYNPIRWNWHRRPSALMNTGENMFVDTLMFENGEIFKKYKEMTLKPGTNWSFFNFMTCQKEYEILTDGYPTSPFEEF